MTSYDEMPMPNATLDDNPSGPRSVIMPESESYFPESAAKETPTVTGAAGPMASLQSADDDMVELDENYSIIRKSKKEAVTESLQVVEQEDQDMGVSTQQQVQNVSQSQSQSLVSDPPGPEPVVNKPQSQQNIPPPSSYSQLNSAAQPTGKILVPNMSGVSGLTTGGGGSQVQVTSPSSGGGGQQQQWMSQIRKAAASRKAAEAKTAALGAVNTNSGFNAGAGGGFGLNAPKFGIKVESKIAKHKAQIEVDEQIGQIWDNVLEDSNPISWIYCTYTNNQMKALQVAASGEGGMKEFKLNITDKYPNEVAWGGFRCYGVDKRGGTEVRRTKFIRVQVKPEGVSMIKKSKMTPHKSDVSVAIHGCHIDLSVESADDLEEGDLIKKLQAATGAHKPNGYEFDKGEFIASDYYGLGIGKECKGESSERNNNR